MKDTLADITSDPLPFSLGYFACLPHVSDQRNKMHLLIVETIIQPDMRLIQNLLEASIPPQTIFPAATTNADVVSAIVVWIAPIASMERLRSISR
ncbi:MAG: hypothetical protein AAF434_11000 [Pseudomonadota bacterium]